MIERKAMLFVINPVAGKGVIKNKIFQIVEKFTKSGFLVTVYLTQSSNDGYDIVLHNSGNYDYIVCAGGDGTLSEVINALICGTNRPILGYIPCGTTNDYASTLSLPKNIMQAVDIICEGNITEIDIGRFNDRYFLYVAAFGLFSDVAYSTNQDLKNIIGHAAYMLEGVKRLASVEYFGCQIICDDRYFSGDFVFGMVANSVSVGGFPLKPKNAPPLESGMFEVMLVKRPRKFADLQKIIAVLLGSEEECKHVITLRASSISVKSVDSAGIKWTLDGEFGGEHFCTDITAIENAVRILTPAQKEDYIDLAYNGIFLP